MSEQTDLGFKTGAADPDRLRQFEVDRTPTPVVRQLMQYLEAEFPTTGKRLKILDPSAGSGVFGKCAAEAWPGSHRIAVEPREEERRWLERHYQLTELATLQQYVGYLPSPVDLVTGNPPFTLWRMFVTLGRAMLKSPGLVVLLGLDDWGQSAEGVEFFEEHPPFFQRRITGRLNMRGPGNNPKTGKPWASDMRGYSWWCWDHHDRDPVTGWHCENLPLLEAHEREWKIEPGRE